VTRKVLFSGLIVAPVTGLGLAISGAGIVAALLPIFVSHILVLYATLNPNCQWWGPIARRFSAKDRQVWLTIDDGPSAQTSEVLDLLAAHDARATFFVIGKQAELYPHAITEIFMRGHELANHTFTHPSGTFWCAWPKRIDEEVSRCGVLLRANEKRPIRFFRAPAGLTNMFVHPIATARHSLVVTGWCARGFDTLLKNPIKVAERILKNVRPGAIILLHERSRRAEDSCFHRECLDLVLRQLTEQGYRCVIPQNDQLLIGRDGEK
jgi:peptidoglycan/xylan/chitin deacetylase (PgdA/CDA1 family)